MKKINYIFIVFLLLLQINLFAGPGDTTIVQTFDFSWPRPTGLNSREGSFVFPSFTGKRFEKVLMYYKLKCDPGQNPQCGEWDYLSYTYLFEHTKKYDSTQYTQQKYKYFNFTGTLTDTVKLRNSPSIKYLPHFESHIVYDNVISFDSTIVGNLTSTTVQPFLSGTPDGRNLYIWKASELIASGLTMGHLSGIRLNISGLSNTTNAIITIRMKQSSSDTLSVPASITNLTTVYNNTTSILSNGWKYFNFIQPYNWDGVSNIILDISYTNNTGNINLLANTTGFTSGLLSSSADNYISFGLNNFLEVPKSRFSMLDSNITIMFWQNGDVNGQPSNCSAFEGVNSVNNRLLNAHLPWSNSNVYWDAGKNTYDRINKLALATDFKGNWNHWAFTKNCQSGSMKIYLNGNLWQSGTAKVKLMDTINRFIIGSALSYQNGNYKGSIDDFSVWNKELNSVSIQQSMFNKITTTHPDFQHLIYSYDFNEGNGGFTNDISLQSQHAAIFSGVQNWQNYKGIRFKNFSYTNYRPVIIFEKGVYQSHIDSTFILDSIQNTPVMIVIYGDNLHPTTPTDTIYKWQSFYRYTYNSNGLAIDSVLSATDTTFIQKNMIYYGSPFEIINKWELGRFITPYGNGLSLGNGWQWIYDVSDFVSLLKDTVNLKAGNFQEMLDLKFAFIEGIPPRDVIQIKNIWQGNFNLSNFDTKVVTKTLPIDSSEKMLKLRTSLTGHGMGATNNCAEFCSNMHKMKVNGQTIRQWQILQPCALNPLYPQGGTWIYDRAAWCPGMPATIQEFELGNYVSNNQISIDYDIDYDPDGNYITESQMVSYSNPNFQNDAALEEIIAPNNYEILSRFNPICGKPIVKIKNTGKNNLTSIDIEYGFSSGNTNIYHWSGNLAFLESSEVKLPTPDWNTISGSAGIFWAQLKLPNGLTDEYLFNNRLSTIFNSVPVFTENEYQMDFFTNYRPDETTWKVEDINGNILSHSDSLMNANSWYSKNFSLPNGCYKITLTDLGDDGLKFWANMPPNGNGTAGQAMLNKKISNGYVTAYDFETDFGREINFSFIVNSASGIKENNPLIFNIFPNPVRDILNINTKNYQLNDIKILIYNTFGEIIKTKFISAIHNENIEINVSDLAKGCYWIQFQQNEKIISGTHFIKI
ncbi:MAG: peptide-N-glycosidase F-related protein [Bacteroidales bacterium]